MNASIKKDMSFLEQLIASKRYDTEELVIQNSDKLINDVRNYLKAAGYDMALACMDLAIEKKENAWRGDGDTPGIIHEVSQAIYTVSLIEDGMYLEDPESVIALNFLHDLGEDYGLKPNKLKSNLIGKGILNDKTLDVLVDDFDLLTKQYLGEPKKFKKEWQYYEALSESLNASIAKFPDRLHNLTTQIGVKKHLRALEYIASSVTIFKRFTKQVSEKFSTQKEAYKAYKEMIDDAYDINRFHYVELEIGMPLDDLTQLISKKPAKGFRNLPAGLSPTCINVQRVLKHSDLPAAEIQKFKENILLQHNI